jgi:putative ABC transport system substrate-binding protein
MRRRNFIVLVGGAAATWPLAARAQQGERVRRIGVISYENENDADERELRDQFIARLRELGWIEGRNLHTDYRFAGNDATRMRAYAMELVELQPDVIFAGYEAVRALKTATTEIPIVFAGGPDPVAEDSWQAWLGPAATLQVSRTILHRSQRRECKCLRRSRPSSPASP